MPIHPRRYRSERQFAEDLVAALRAHPELRDPDCPSWTEGDCLNLAVALSAELGRDAEVWTVVCRSLDDTEHGCHAYVRLPGGTCVDGEGAHTEEELMRASNEWHEYEQGLYSEQRTEPLRRWHADHMNLDKRRMRALRQFLAAHFGGGQ